LSNLIWNRTGLLNPILPELIWEQAPEQIQNLFHQVSRGEWKACLWILTHDFEAPDSHPLDQILSDINTRVQTKSKLKNFCTFYAFLFNIEPKNVHEAFVDYDWVNVMQDELH